MSNRREAVARALTAELGLDFDNADETDQQAVLKVADVAIAAMTAGQTCPECNGDGEIQHLQAWDIPGATQKCPTCRGTGTAPHRAD